MQRILADLTVIGDNGSQNTTIIDPVGSRFANIGTVITTLLPYIFAAAGIGLLLMIVSSGFGMLTSAGDAKKLEGAKHQLTNAVIGFVIIFIAFWLVQLAGQMFGIQSIRDIFQ